ncbi:carboxymuconolactone decarboxylase family protein [Acuticoccus kandeliae]|uniref:carboxymuconolactone decarboxylase family protein n=1 Tax=Acuticoccus kandeliae TaxID=2073160 RepID=UPI000D3E5226|nr:carboxymuconolactone decarboxylase family protein [Acuticoccus kandeliae]
MSFTAEVPAIGSGRGFTTGLGRALAGNPAAREAYAALSAAFAKGTLTPVERHVALLAAARATGSPYCVAVHSALAAADGVAPDLLDASRTGGPLADPRLEALRAATVALASGTPGDAVIAPLAAAGYDREVALQLAVAVAAKTFSARAAEITGTPLDDVFKPYSWRPTRGGRTGA